MGHLGICPTTRRNAACAHLRPDYGERRHKATSTKANFGRVVVSCEKLAWTNTSGSNARNTHFCCPCFFRRRWRWRRTGQYPSRLKSTHPPSFSSILVFFLSKSVSYNRAILTTPRIGTELSFWEARKKGQ